MLRRSLDIEDGVEVSSRGLAGGPGETPEPLRHVLSDRDLDLASDTGAVLQREDARNADLLLFLERRLLRDAVVTDPTLWPRSFTVREFARRAFVNPPERDVESFAEWLAVLHAARSRDELLGEDEVDDIADPGLHGDVEQFTVMVDTLEREIGRISPFLSGWSSISG